MNEPSRRVPGGMRGRSGVGFTCLRQADKRPPLAVLRTVWTMRWRGVPVSIARPSSDSRYLFFSARRDGRTSTVAVDVQACIAWRFPDAIEFAWWELSDAALKTIVEHEPWDRFVPAPAGGWEELILARVGPPDEPARSMVEVAYGGVRFLYEHLGWPLDIDVEANRGAISGSVPIVVRVDVGYTLAPLSLIATLRAGDAIKISVTTLTLRACASPLLKLSLADGVLTVAETPFPSSADAMDGAAPALPDVHQNDSAVTDVGPIALDALPMALSFAFAPFVLSLAELTSLRAGDMVPLEGSAHLAIYLNGKRVGSAELVEVEGALAAEVTSVQLASGTKNA